MIVKVGEEEFDLRIKPITNGYGVVIYNSIGYCGLYPLYKKEQGLILHCYIVEGIYTDKHYAIKAKLLKYCRKIRANMAFI